MAEADGGAAAFVDALYRKVLLSVKASNGVPSEDDGFHFHSKFSSAFSARAASSGAKAQSLVQLLTSKRQDKDADDSEEEDEAAELFDGPEPNARITDVVDTLLDEAAKQLELFRQGGDKPKSAGAKLRPLENKPLEFKKKEQEAEREVKARPAPPKHAHALRKPQDDFDETIDNSDAPFVSKLREKVHALHDVGQMEVDEDDNSEEAQQQRRHPYYHEIRALKYAEWQLEASSDPYARISVEDASYLWVDTEETLLQMMASLTKPETRVVAVDLEHHSYRSYLGIVCLMQISTATEDFLVDTLALRSKLQLLNSVFCDPSKVKVLHGSDMDILWLQRDLGLYVVNMFDTGQAARLLQYQRFSLAYLLKRHCSVDADKQYQLADWRVRPLDKNMVKYAREDTRYLLYIYDQMKQELLAESATSRSNMLFEALQNSSKICLQVYDKPQALEADALPLLDRLKGTVGLAAPSELQQRVFKALYLWRDQVARREDESTAYVLPNHALMKLTKHLPTRSDALFRTCHPVPALIRKHAHEITSMISSEQTKLATEEVQQVASEQTVAPAVPTKKVWNDDGVERDVVMSTLGSATSSKDTAHVAWTTGKRKAKCFEDGLVPGVLQLGGVDPVVEASEEDKARALLQQVNDLVARVSFTVRETEGSAGAVEAVKPTPAKPATAEAPPAMPQSIAETYQLPGRSKRRKVAGKTEALTSEVKDRAADFMQQIGMGQSSASGDAEDAAKPQFDYAAASEQIAGAKLDLDKKSTGAKRKQKPGGGGYNPFAAVRGGGGSGGPSKDDEGVKQPRRKKQHNPRSATFR